MLKKWLAGLAKTRRALGEGLAALLARPPDPQTVAAFEQALLMADLGPKTTQRLLDAARRAAGVSLNDAVRATLIADLKALDSPPTAGPTAGHPFVILLVGVNGTGKTTTAGRLAYLHRQAGRTVLLAAADTFRSAAIEQLAIWAQRTGAEFIRHRPGADPAAVAFDATKAALAREIAVVVIDTAGRLHTKHNLMEELKKVRRIVAREAPGAPHEVLLVLDATTGQHALVQAREFTEAVGVTGLVVTKLDGTSKGGAVVAIAQELGLPVRYVGLGEALDDLQPFDPEAFVEALISPISPLRG